MALYGTGRPVTEERRQYVKDWRARRTGQLRLRVFEAYGNRCTCCGEDNVGFLTVDHVNGGGREHRRSRNTRQILLDIVRSGFSSDYTILCFNCNCGRDRNGGICPHREAPR